jgi:hypothetical protein
METQDLPTCGQGLAEQSELPAKLGDLIASLAENLEIHMKALDLKDQNARKELEAYVKLAKEHRQIAVLLTVTASEMAGYRNLPMARHDAKAMSHPKVFQTFEKFVAIEQDLLAMLQRHVEQDQKMLAEISGAEDRLQVQP